MKRKGHATLVGAFVVGAFAVLAGFVVFTGGLTSLRDKNERFVLVFRENIYGLKQGGKVTLNGVRIGRVERFFLGAAEQDAPVPILVEIDRRLVLRHMDETGNELFDSDGEFRDDVLPRIQGQLVQESFVTGIQYINLEYHSSQADANMTTRHGYPQIVTQASTMEQLSENLDPEYIGKQLTSLLKTANQRLEELNVIAIKDSFTSSSRQFDVFIDEFSKNFVPLGPKLGVASDEATKTMAELRKLSLALNKMLDPSSDFRFDFGETLREISASMKAIKNLAELLERNPQSIIRGKGEDQK
ncbi:MAG: MlaD family protein [Opitutales bacterium]|nr:MlaD family protein [Opitutales bacterium]